MDKNKKKPNQFKVWLVSNGIGHTELSLKSGLGITVLHYLINDSRATKRTIRMVADSLRKDFGKDITESIITNMISIN